MQLMSRQIGSGICVAMFHRAAEIRTVQYLRYQNAYLFYLGSSGSLGYLADCFQLRSFIRELTLLLFFCPQGLRDMQISCK